MSRTVCMIHRFAFLFLISFVFTAHCQVEGDIRLVLSTPGDPLSGVVQVYFNGMWGTISYGLSTWVANNAKVVCRQINANWKANNNIDHAGIDLLNLRGSAYVPLTNAFSRDVPVWIGNLQCGGTETKLSDCENFFPTNPTGLTHANGDLFVRCGFSCTRFSGIFCNESCSCDSRFGMCSSYSSQCTTCNRAQYGSDCTVYAGSSCAYGTCPTSSTSPIACNPPFALSSCFSTCPCGTGCSTDPAATAFNCKCPLGTSIQAFGSGCTLSSCGCTGGFCGCPSSSTSSCGTCTECFSNISGATCNVPCGCTNGYCFSSPVIGQQCRYCQRNFSGSSCNIQCACVNGYCGRDTTDAGTCIACMPGWTGVNCGVPCNCTGGSCSVNPLDPNICAVCNAGLTGSNCNVTCSCVNGNCSTDPNALTGSGCAVCAPGFYGPGCNSSCGCTNGKCSTSITANGDCIECNQGWTGNNCTTPCNCSNGFCSTAVNGGSGCTSCLPGFYGPNCVQCRCNSSSDVCDDGLRGGGECYPEGYMRLPTASPFYPNIYTKSWSGRVEIWSKKRWNSVCFPASTVIQGLAVSLMCKQWARQLGYPDTIGTTASGVASTGNGGAPIGIFSATCPSNATDLIRDCRINRDGSGLGSGDCYASSASSFLSLRCDIDISCPANSSGPTCAPCTCINGVCVNTREANGTCPSCNSVAWTGQNCDIPCLCPNGQCSGSSQCASCNENFFGNDCRGCNCTLTTFYCSDEIYGDGRCTSPSLRKIRLRPTGEKKGILEIQYTQSDWVPVDYSNSLPIVAAANSICQSLFGPSANASANVSYQPNTIFGYAAPSTPYYVTYPCTGTTFVNFFDNCLYFNYGISSTALLLEISCDFPSGCGNNYIEGTEKCDGGRDCNSDCTCPLNYDTTPGLLTKSFVGCTPVPVDCTWNLWSSWAACDASCSITSRSRDFKPAANGGKPCDGSGAEFRVCDLKECSVQCSAGVSKFLSECSAQFASVAAQCNTQRCEAYDKAICVPDPCSNCGLQYFVDGIKVDCTPRTDTQGGKSNNGYTQRGNLPNNLPRVVKNNRGVVGTKPDNLGKSSGGVVISGGVSGWMAVVMVVICALMNIFG